MKQTWMTRMLILVCLTVGGCETESERLADLADRTIEMQSQQNSTIAKTTSEMVELNREIQTERKELAKEYGQLESDRRDLHQLRRSELAWAETFQFLAMTIAASSPLFLCAYLVWASTLHANEPDLVNEVLMQELIAKQPRLIAGSNSSSAEHHPELNEPNRFGNSTNQQEENN